MKHVKLRITGKVQGVFFRHYTQLKAHELGVNGFVRNERDGSVYAEAEGDEQAVGRFVAWCHEGSPASRVQHVEVTEGEPAGHGPFSVSRRA